MVNLLASGLSGCEHGLYPLAEGDTMHLKGFEANEDASPLPGGGRRSLRLAMEIRDDGPRRWAWSLSVLAVYVCFAFVWAGMVRSTMDTWVGTHPWVAYSVGPFAMLVGVLGVGVLAVSFLRVGPPPFSR